MDSLDSMASKRIRRSRLRQPPAPRGRQVKLAWYPSFQEPCIAMRLPPRDREIASLFTVPVAGDLPTLRMVSAGVTRRHALQCCILSLTYSPTRIAAG